MVGGGVDNRPRSEARAEGSSAQAALPDRLHAGSAKGREEVREVRFTGPRLLLARPTAGARIEGESMQWPATEEEAAAYLTEQTRRSVSPRTLQRYRYAGRSPA